MAIKSNDENTNNEDQSPKITNIEEVINSDDNKNILTTVKETVINNVTEQGDEEIPSKTWKSTVAFFLFLVIYAYTVYMDRSAEVIDITGYIALISMAFMMLRDRRLGELINKVLSIKFNK